MGFSTVDSVPVELLGRERHLRLSLMAPTWYKTITHKPMTSLILLLQHQLQAGSAAARTNEAHAKALGVEVGQLSADELVDSDSLLDLKDRVDIADMVPDVVAAIYVLAHWEDVVNRPEHQKTTVLPGEVTIEDLELQLDADAYPMLLLLIVEVWQAHMMKPGKDTEAAADDPNAKSPALQSSGLSEDVSSALPLTNS